ncbi:VPLPA-CTERM sorting domain-containing protein [Rhodobacterales bacterium HKCCE3408]|nr:VPLPA-CTERM sorting domain-containing protein [Rhodobacterales bacterium HKCCE3408]
MRLSSTIKAAAVAALFALGGTAASAVTLQFGESATSSNSPPTGASGTVEMTFSDIGAGLVELSMLITNTTGDTIFGAGATASKLTGVGFDLLSGVSYVAGSFSGGTYLDTLIINAALPPFGIFDIGVADNGNFLGGNANGALPQGLSDTVTMRLSSSLLAADLDAAFASGFTSGDLAASLRFQQVNAGEGSDKLTDPTVDMSPVPIPAAGFLLVAGLGGLAVLRRRAAA